MTRCNNITLLFCMFAFVFLLDTNAFAGIDMSFLGIVLGQPLDIKYNCNNLDYNSINTRCINSLNAISDVEVKGDVCFSSDIVPKYILGCAEITVFKNIVSAINISVYVDDEAALNDLRSKYGTPRETPYTFQNKYGATFYIHDYNCSSDKLGVLFRDYTEQIFGGYNTKIGHIYIVTGEYLDFFSNRKNEEDRKKPKL